MWAHLGSFVLCLVVVQTARISRKRQTSAGEAPTKFIAGVPVFNYHAAYQGEPTLVGFEGEREAEWVVVVKAQTTDAQIESMCKASPKACNLVGSPSKGGVPFLELRGKETDLEAIIHSVPGVVEFVEPDQMLYMIPELESDSAENLPWGLNRIGADRRSRAGAGASIFVLDTGVRVSHNEFGGRAVPTLDMSVGDPRECNGDLGCAGDRQGHGTHCAGSAAGETYGVAPSAAVRGMKVLGDAGSGALSWSYYALNWLATHREGAAVASMSLGASGRQAAMETAVNSAVNAGVIVVVAGGNDNGDACGFSPAFVPSAITVGSTTSRDTRSYFSNYGSCTNIWAPGSDILSAGIASDTATDTMSGTSMACPHVSGAAALALGADPTKKSSAVLSELLEGAVLNGISGLMSGDTNALLYVGEGGPPPTPEPVPTPAPTPCNWDFERQQCVNIPWVGKQCVTLTCPVRVPEGINSQCCSGFKNGDQSNCNEEERYFMTNGVTRATTSCSVSR